MTQRLNIREPRWMEHNYPFKYPTIKQPGFDIPIRALKGTSKDIH